MRSQPSLCHRLLATAAALTLSVSLTQSLTAASVDEHQAALTAAITAHAGIDDATKGLVTGTLLPLISHEALLAGAVASNGLGRSLDDIQAIDAEWRAAEDLLPIHEQVLVNPAAEALQALVEANAAIVEVFATDNQGANFAQSGLTSDFWQGDEAKWQNSFNEGNGGIDVGEVEYDESADAYLQQVSLPLVAADGSVIGAVTFGLQVQR